MGIEIGGEIEKVNGKEMSYSEFVERYMKKNQPVVLTGLMNDWKACRDWVTEFWDIQSSDCGTREFTDQKRTEMTVGEFVEQWLQDSMQELSTDRSKMLLYLKDWHFVKEYPEYTAYTTPKFFCDDWLNTYHENYRMHNDPNIYSETNDISCSDYRYVYMGTKGTWTPLHADVFRSYSWSAFVCGKKRWLFLSPFQSHLVFDRNMKSSVYNIFDDVNETKIPGFSKGIWLECTQELNGIIFVPSGWYHQVHNLWDLLSEDYNEAKEYIEDIEDICDDFEGLCQRNLAANTGMNFSDFLLFLARFSFANLILLHYLSKKNGNQIQNLSPIAQHFIFNLVSTHKIASSMNSVEDLTGFHGFYLDFRETINDPGFIKLSIALGQTYGMIHTQHNQNFDKEAWIDDMKDLDFLGTCHSQLRTPRDLLKFIEHAVAEFSGV